MRRRGKNNGKRGEGFLRGRWKITESGTFCAQKTPRQPGERNNSGTARSYLRSSGVYAAISLPLWGRCRRQATDEVVSRTKTVWFNILRIRNAHGGRLPPLRIGRGVEGLGRGFFVYAGFMAAGCRRYGLGAGLLARNEVFFVYAGFMAAWRPPLRRYKLLSSP